MNRERNQMWRQEFIYAFRYLCAGVINSSIGFCVIFLVMFLGGSAFVSNIIGYAIGFFISFVLSKKFVFRSQGKLNRETVRYALVFFVSFLLNLLILHACLNFEIYPYIAQIIAAFFYTGSMFLMSRFFVFK